MDLYLDHVLIAVHDLERSRQTYANLLGFNVTPEGIHPGRGTHNRLIVFGPEYLELIAICNPQEARADRPQMLDFLKRRQGLYMFALGSPNLDMTIADIRRGGGRISDAVDGARTGAVDKGGYTWRSAYLDPEDTPGSATFIIQHNHTIQQRYTEPANPTVHANGVTGIFSLSLAVKDAPVAAGIWSHTFGIPIAPVPSPSQGEGQDGGAGYQLTVRLTLDNCYLDFLSPTSDGPLACHLEAHGESPYMLSLKVADLERTVKLLEARGITLSALRKTGGSLRRAVAETQAEGANLELVQAV